jgi:hypothetical protein
MCLSLWCAHFGCPLEGSQRSCVETLRHAVEAWYVCSLVQERLDPCDLPVDRVQVLSSQLRSESLDVLQGKGCPSEMTRDTETDTETDGRRRRRRRTKGNKGCL